MEAALFDWDGTLVDSLGPLYRANLAVMRSFGLAYDEATYRSTYQPDWRRMYGRLGIPAERLDEANELWHAAYDGGSASALFPGAAEALERLARTGLRLGLVTAGERSVVAPQLARLGLAGLFDVEVFGDDHADPQAGSGTAPGRPRGAGPGRSTGRRDLPRRLHR